MTTQESNVNVPNGFVSWEEVVGETIKLATSSMGIATGLVGVVAAPVAVALINKAVDAYKEHAAREAFKAEEQAFQQAERAAEKAREQAETDAAERTFAEAEAAARKGDSKQAAALLGEAAAGGSPEAIYALGMSLLKSEKPDYKLAEKALRIASDAGIDDATLQLALLLYRNATIYTQGSTYWRKHPNRKEYIELVRKLAEKNLLENVQAVNLYGFELVADGKYDELEDLLDRVFTPTKFSDVFTAFMSGRRQPVESIKLLYISTYTDLPESEKMKRLKLCAKKGYLPAQNNLAIMYKESDPDECRRLLIDAARKGNGVSLRNLVSTDCERFGSEGAISRYIASMEKDDVIGARALAHMCGMDDEKAKKVFEIFWEKASDLRMTIPRSDGSRAVAGIDALGGKTAAIVGECAREARAKNKPFAEYVAKRADELGYMKPYEMGTYTVLEGVSKKNGEDPYALARPNDPCPCGSGKKYKKCHGLINPAALRSSSS